MTSPLEPSRERAQNIALLRRDYLGDPDVTALVISERCTAFGHPAKIDKPVELKSDWQKGCVCGRNPYA